MAECLLLKNGGGINSDDLTATKAQVLSGYTAMTNDSDDDVGTGTMPNRGAVNQSLNAGGSYTIPQGYHNGSGKVTANSLASQTSGNAGAPQILSGYNAWVDGKNVNGTMANRGTVNQSLNAGGSYTIPQGYHNGSGKVTANSLASQTSGNANASHILTGHDAWVNGSHINGSMPNRGSLNFNPSSSTSQSVASGYYSGGTLSTANAYNAGFSAGKNDATIQTREVSGSQNNFSSYTDHGLDHSVKINPPSLSGYTILGAYIKKIYISNTNKTFGSGTFEVMKSGSVYYVISKDCTWPGGSTSVNATVTFIYQK